MGRVGPGTPIPGLGVGTAHDGQWGMPGSLGFSLRFSGGESHLSLARSPKYGSYMRSKESTQHSKLEETEPWVQIQDEGSSHLAKLCW